MKASRSWPTWCSAMSSNPSVASSCSHATCCCRSEPISTLPRRSSGRTNAAATSNASGVSRSQQIGGSKTFVRHWSCAIRSASASVSAHDRWTCRTSRPSRPNASIIRRRCSTGALTVASPSAHVPPHAAVCSLTAAHSSGGGVSGRVHKRARSTSTSPEWETSSPANSARITSTHSPSRAVRTSFGGQRSPVMCSLEASPDPRAIHSRSGNSSHSVAAAWAMTAGW
jgi:hypothetical protein